MGANFVIVNNSRDLAEIIQVVLPGNKVVQLDVGESYLCESDGVEVVSIGSFRQGEEREVLPPRVEINHVREESDRIQEVKTFYDGYTTRQSKVTS